MNSQLYLWEITKYLAWFTSQVKIENKNGNFDINKYAEGFLIPILNRVFQCDFERLEFIKQNYPAIDLGCRKSSISIQVTSEIGFEKIKNTLSKFIEKKLFNEFAEIYHLVINEDYKTTKNNDEILQFIDDEIAKLDIQPSPKVSFLVGKNLINISTLRSLIERKCDVDGLKEIRDYLEKEYGKVILLPYFDDILIPYQIAFKTQLDPDNKNLPYQFHKPFFGRETDFEKLEKFITDGDSDVFVLVSEGGYGKTRLIVELFKKRIAEDQETEAFLLNESAFQCLEFAEQLRTDKKVLILFDDAHNRPEILNDVFGVAQRLGNVKVILTVRKAAFSDILKTVASHRRILEVLELNRLSYEETQALFKSNLGGLKSFEIKRLSEESRGIPIVILGLCQVALQGKYKSELSETINFIQFVKEVKDQVIIDIHNKYYIEKQKINKVIELISFFAPVKNSSEEIGLLAHLNLMDNEETSLIIDYLSEYEFIRKHQYISIVPDPYSDTILLGSAHRLKYLLQREIGVFIDRLIRNLVEVEQSQRLELNVDSLLYQFIESFKEKKIGSYEDIRLLESNLDTLKSFAYKKPQVCFMAVSYLISSQIENKDFWKENDIANFYSSSFKTVHESIETIFSIVALNTHKSSEFESLYRVMSQYRDLRLGSKVFNKVFRYRIYDFYEYGYRPHEPCERQQFLINKLKFRIDNEEVTKALLGHLLDSCHIVLAHEFEGENFYDKYTHSFSLARHHVFFNETIKNLRKSAINILIDVYSENRYILEFRKCFDLLLGIFFFMVKPAKDTPQFNNNGEIELVVRFFKTLLSDKPNIFERSSIVRQLKLFKRKELKEEYIESFTELLILAENVSKPREKLELMFNDEYISIRTNIKEKIEALFKDYDDLESFFEDITEVKSSMSNDRYSNFHEVVSHLVSNYKAESKSLLEFVITLKPHLVCDFARLINANYKDQEYFYRTIDKIWNLEIDCVNGTVLWMLTYGRNREVELYREKDLDFIENVIEKKMTKALMSISFSLPDYMSVAPKKTISLITQILHLQENSRESERLISTLFEDRVLLKANAELIRDFIFDETVSIPLDSYSFDKALFFLEDFFGFDCLFEYLKNRVSLLERRKNYFSLSLRKHYNNPRKERNQFEVDFLKVIAWYAELPNKDKYLHKKIVKYLRPTKIASLDFANGFKTLVQKSKNDKSRLLDLFDTINGYSHKTDFIVSLQIELVNDLCNTNEFTKQDLIHLLGSDYIYNSGGKSGTPGEPFPQDLRKRKELNRFIKEYSMDEKVKEIFLYALDIVNRDIDERFGRIDEEW